MESLVATPSLFSDTKAWDSVHYAFGVFNSSVGRLRNIYHHTQFYDGLPKAILEHPENVFDPKKKNLLILGRGRSLPDAF